jgi:hypothetical protein
MSEAGNIGSNETPPQEPEVGGDDGPKARRCAIPGCPTTLSVYNHGYLCFVHSNQKAAQTLTRFPYRPERHYSE